jgi:hypothetical protein
MNTTTLKYLSAFVAGGVWVALVVLNINTPQSAALVTAIQIYLAGLSGHALTGDAKNAPTSGAIP